MGVVQKAVLNLINVGNEAVAENSDLLLKNCFYGIKKILIRFGLKSRFLRISRFDLKSRFTRISCFGLKSRFTRNIQVSKLQIKTTSKLQH